MSWNARPTAVAAVVLGLTILGLVGPGSAADDKNPRADIDKIAEMLAKDPKADVSKDAAMLKSLGLKPVMKLFKLRKAGGAGVGVQADTIKPDGIEAKIDSLREDELSPAALAKESDALKMLGYRVVALAAFAEVKAPAKDDKKKKVADWVAWSKEMKTGGLALAAAVEKKDPAGVKKAADVMGKSCIKCHDIFRDDD